MLIRTELKIFEMIHKITTQTNKNLKIETAKRERFFLVFAIVRFRFCKNICNIYYRFI